jgi:hypothetical protein
VAGQVRRTWLFTHVFFMMIRVVIDAITEPNAMGIYNLLLVNRLSHHYGMN